jgi:hypothetical protein
MPAVDFDVVDEVTPKSFRKNAFRMAVEMGCFRMGQWAPLRPMASEGKTPFAAEKPEPLAVGFDCLRSGESSLAVSDRAVGPGQEWGIWTHAVWYYSNHSGPHVGGSVQTENNYRHAKSRTARMDHA